MRSKRGRVLIAVLVSASIVALTVIMVSRGAAVTTQIAPTGSVFTVPAAANVVRALPLNTPVSISVSETGVGSTATTTIVACSDGTAWSWVGLNGNGAVAQGHNVVAVNAPMCTTLAGPYVLTVSAALGQIRVVAGASTARVYIHW